MTRLQRKVLLFLQAEQDRGNSVTVSEIAEATGHLRGNCHTAIGALVALGLYVTRRARRARSYEVIRRVEPIVEHWVWCPVFKELVKIERGEIAA